MDLKDKRDSDIATYGKVLGSKVLMNKIEATERKILKKIDSIENLQAKIDAKFKLSYRDNKVLKVIRSNDPTTNTASESTYRFDHRFSGSASQRRLLKRKAEESFGTESFEADVESVVSELRELGMPEIVFGDDEERIKINGELVYKIESAPLPIRDGIYSQPLFYIDSKDEFGTWYMDNPLQQFSPPIWIRTPKGLIKNTRFHRNKILERKIQRRLQEDYGEYTKKNPFECLCGKRFKNENALKKHQGDKKHPNYHPSHTLFDNELKGPPINNIINPDGITLKEVYLMFPNWDGNYKTWFGRGEKPLQDGFNYFNAESFEAAYTPEQKLDDYTPEQLTTSSAVTGDFFEDSLKYSYGGTQAAEEIPQEETEIVYAEGFPALQNAEAGMVVENIENYYIDKEDKFMTLVVDEATLFRLASDLPIFVELTPSKYAGYTNLRFNYVENPDLEQKILSYAISLPSNMEQQEEPEYLAGDVRNRLFNVEFDDWAEQEMKTHGDKVSFKDWADEESKSHGDEEFMDWAKHEEESHDERYEAEGGRNVSDFEMGNTDRYEIGDEIIALSSALKRAGDWDWKNVKKIGKGIKQGKYERIQKNMADIDYKTRRVLWDKHHNDFYSLFNDEQMRGLAIPWVTDKYRAESFDAQTWNIKCDVCGEKPIYDTVDSEDYGKEIQVCEECFNGIFAAESFEAEKINTFSEIENEWKDSPVTIYDEADDEFYGVKEILVQEEDDVLEDGQPYLVLNKDSGDLDSQVFYRDFQTGYYAESFEAKEEVKPRKLCVKCSKQRLTPHATKKGITVCATCQRRFGLKSKKAEFFEAQPVNISDDMIIDYLKNSHKVIRKYTAPYRFTKNGIAREFNVKETWMANKLRELEKKGLIDSSVMRRTEDSLDGSYSLKKPVKIYKLAGTELNRDLMRADEEYKFVSRIPKSMGIGEKTEILRNNLEYVIKKANRPLYPREVVELYNRERGSGKQSRFKKGGLSTGKISSLIKSEPQKDYVSRSGFIHHVAESSMKDYIKKLHEECYAEENNRRGISEENILKYLQNSHEYIRKYNAPWKYTSYGMAEQI